MLFLFKKIKNMLCYIFQSKSPTRNLRSRSRSKSPPRRPVPKDAWASGAVTDNGADYRKCL